MKMGDYLFGLVVMVAIGWMAMSCKKNVDPQPLTPRVYDIPELDEEELDDLPTKKGKVTKSYTKR